ncbi:hypothetical protein EDD22DRAFT_847620 [Suillus occidentalis]|nr:hypothetical protein EDD22DRAFT_847620 [Suillus occidentalis]
MSIYSNKQGYTHPPYLSLNWLENSFLSEEALAAQIADAQRHMLDQYGFIIFNLLQDPDWRMHPAMAPLVEPLHLRALLMSTGPFDPKALGANGHDMATHLKSQMTLALALRKGKEREASPKHLAGPVQKKPAKYITVQKVGEEDKARHISKNKYKRLMECCQGVHKLLPGGDIFYAYEKDTEDKDNTMSAGPVVTAKDMAVHNMPGQPGLFQLLRLLIVTQGVTTQGAVNKEPAQVTVTAPIAEAIKVSVAPVPDSGTEPHEEGEASFTPGSPIAPWIPQDISTTPPSPWANSRPLSPPDVRVVLPASLDLCSLQASGCIDDLSTMSAGQATLTTLRLRPTQDRVHTVEKVLHTEQKLKTKQVPNPHAEQVPTLMLRPSMSQLQACLQGIIAINSEVHQAQAEKHQVINELHNLQEAHSHQLLAEQQCRQAVEAQLTSLTQQLELNAYNI